MVVRKKMCVQKSPTKSTLFPDGEKISLKSAVDLWPVSLWAERTLCHFVTAQCLLYRIFFVSGCHKKSCLTSPVTVKSDWQVCRQKMSPNFHWFSVNFCGTLDHFLNWFFLSFGAFSLSVCGTSTYCLDHLDILTQFSPILSQIWWFFSACNWHFPLLTDHFDILTQLIEKLWCFWEERREIEAGAQLELQKVTALAQEEEEEATQKFWASSSLVTTLEKVHKSRQQTPINPQVWLCPPGLSTKSGHITR